MSEPLVSVLLPVRDAAPTLGAALRSVERQTEPRFECVIVDDGSRDGSLAVARAFATRDARFVVLSRPALGIVPALNAGLARCRGRYVARMDSDDLMHRSRLAKQSALLEAEPSLAGAGCHVRLFPRRRLTRGLASYEQWLCSVRHHGDLEREAYVECPLAHPTFCLRRELFARFGYEDHGWPEDYDLVLRLLAAGERLGVVAEPLLLWRDGPGRLSRTGSSYTQERFTACRAFYLARNFLAAQRDYVLWGYGDTGRTLCRALARHERLPSHIVELHPGRLGQRIAGAPVVAPEALRALRPARIVVSVAGLEARTLIRGALQAMDFVEGEHFVCAA